MHATSRRAIALCLLLLGAAAAHAQPAAAPGPTSGAPAAFAALPLSVVGPQAGLGDVLVLGTGAHFVRATSDGGAVTIDGAVVTDSALAGPWTPGAHSISVQPPASAPPATMAPLRFVFDNGAPRMQWEVGDTRLLDRYGLDQNVSRQDPPRRTDPTRDRHVKVLWSPDGRRWLPVLPKGAKTDPSGALADWLIAADKPQVFLWALDDEVFGPGVPVQPKEMQLVRVWSDDQLSAVRDLRLRVLPGDAGDRERAYRLEMVATDLVGNKTTVTWALARH